MTRETVLKGLNASFAEFHNQHLQKTLEDLKEYRPDITDIYADYYHAFLGILDRAEDYGTSR
ncbi:hypothetical protein Taro_037220 [Colocasia esculenta]|uniref:Uncharacterized protein n=1 Tax=Colocasia esculenta TaxID=4460 RepID=A0A843VZV5_COLES|nr:hypothetical protein [Colocasia esculenta]